MCRDEEQTDGQTATNAIAKFANMSAQGIGLGNGKPFFHAVGFHKPHTPYIVPEKYFDLYDINTVGLAPNNKVRSLAANVCQSSISQYFCRPTQRGVQC